MIIDQKDLEQKILFEPAEKENLACDSLKIITGYTDADRIATHLIQLADGIKNKKYAAGIKVEIILGMTQGIGLTRKKHQKLLKLFENLNNTKGMPKIKCYYIIQGKQVHSKVYIWGKKKKSEIAFCGSANYTMNAFYKRRECMTECDSQEALKYYCTLKKDCIKTTDPEVENIIHFTAATVQNDEIAQDNIEELNWNMYKDKKPLDEINISLLKANGEETGYGSGINWGIRKNGLKRNPDQAYIPYNKKDKKKGFFPDRKKKDEIQWPLFKVITKDAGAFYMRIAQENGKALHTPESNAILGEWIRKKMRLASGTFITKEMLEEYGRTYVTFKKYDDGIYLMDF